MYSYVIDSDAPTNFSHCYLSHMVHMGSAAVYSYTAVHKSEQRESFSTPANLQ